MTDLETVFPVFGIDRGDDDSASFGTIERTDKDMSIFDGDKSTLSDTSSIPESVVQFFFFTDDHSSEIATEMCKRDHDSDGNSNTAANSATLEQESTTYSCDLSPSRSSFSFHCEDDSNSLMQVLEASRECRAQEKPRVNWSSLHPEEPNVPPLSSVSDSEDSTAAVGGEFLLADDVVTLSDDNDDYSLDCDFDEAFIDLILCLCREACDGGDGNNEQAVVPVRTPQPASNESSSKEALVEAGLVPAPYLPPQANNFFVDGRRLLSSAHNGNNTLTRMPFPPPGGGNEMFLSSRNGPQPRTTVSCHRPLINEMFPSSKNSLQPRTKASGDQPQESRHDPFCATSDWPQKNHNVERTIESVQMTNFLKPESTLDDGIDTTFPHRQSPLKSSPERDAIEKDERVAVPCQPSSRRQHLGAKQCKKCAQDGECASSRKEKVIIYELTENDYLTGRGGHVSRQPCNQRIREMIQGLAPSYSYHGSRARKSKIVDQVIAEIHAKGGRILERDPETYGWIECSGDECRLKVRQRFREEVSRARRSSD